MYNVFCSDKTHRRALVNFDGYESSARLTREVNHLSPFLGGARGSRSWRICEGVAVIP